MIAIASPKIRNMSDSAISEMMANTVEVRRALASLGFQPPPIKYTARAFRKGYLLWDDEAYNLVTTVGKNDILDKYLAGSSYTAAWYVGLVDNSGFSAYNAADTMSSHSGWTESTSYDEATRVAASWASAASSGTKTSSATSNFTISATVTLDGCFMNTVSTKGGTTGILYSAGAFSGGDKSLADNDVLQITLSASQT